MDGQVNIIIIILQKRQRSISLYKQFTIYVAVILSRWNLWYECCMIMISNCYFQKSINYIIVTENIWNNITIGGVPLKILYKKLYNCYYLKNQMKWFGKYASLEKISWGLFWRKKIDR